MIIMRDSLVNNEDTDIISGEENKMKIIILSILARILIANITENFW